MVTVAFCAEVGVCDMAEWSADTDRMMDAGLWIDEEEESGYDEDGYMMMTFRGTYEADYIEAYEHEGGEPDEVLTGYRGLSRAEDEIREIFACELGPVHSIETEVCRWVHA